jgi:hypothetical protein
LNSLATTILNAKWSQKPEIDAKMQWAAEQAGVELQFSEQEVDGEFFGVDLS